MKYLKVGMGPFKSNLLLTLELAFLVDIDLLATTPKRDGTLIIINLNDLIFKGIKLQNLIISHEFNDF